MCGGVEVWRYEGVWMCEGVEVWGWGVRVGVVEV